MSDDDPDVFLGGPLHGQAVPRRAVPDAQQQAIRDLGGPWAATNYREVAGRMCWDGPDFDRWEAFTDDELVALANSIARHQIYLSDLGRSAEPEETLREQMEAEITRRRQADPLPFTEAWFLALPGVVSVETPEAGVALVTLTFNAPESTRDTIMDRRLNNVTVRFKVADKPHHVSVLVGDVRPAMGPDNFVMPDDARVVGDAPPLPGGLVGYILHSERAGTYYGIGGRRRDHPDVHQVRSQASGQELAERLLVQLAGEWAAKHGA